MISSSTVLVVYRIRTPCFVREVDLLVASVIGEYPGPYERLTVVLISLLEKGQELCMRVFYFIATPADCRPGVAC
jgi:hypothetical protein